ncbi:MAG: hypothetical protein QNJ98_01990 [Planctomycetota bacterium]|nr:hypothetical protein [Planctomycetota bacterium]
MSTERDHHEQPAATRGHALGFGALLLVAAALTVLLYVLTWNPQPSTAGLATFLERGPTTGMWETRRLYSVRRAYFAPLPGDPSRLLMAPVPGHENPAGCQTCDEPCSYTRPQVMQFFFEAPSRLFFRNYRMIKAPVPAELLDGRKAYVAVWAPRLRDGGLSEREVWFDQTTGEVVQVEDYSRTGRLVRRARKLSDDTGDWDPNDFDRRKGPVCCADCPSEWLPEMEQLASIAEEAEIPLYRPVDLPPGFRFVRADYREVTVPAMGTADIDDDTTPPARIVTLLYSDGMALISIGIARTPEMDALERSYAEMRRERPEDDDGQACPTLPAEPKRIPIRDTTVRMRTDDCRTVLRRDDVGGMSVTLLGRNELTLDEYLAVIARLERVLPLPEDE